MRPYKAEINWIDHATTTGWVNKNEKIETVTMHSFAWVVDETKDTVAITDTLDANGNSRYPLAIARKLITKIKRLK